MFSIIDTHAHLDLANFDRDRSDVIKRARKAGVSAIINVGIDLKSSECAIKLAEANPDIFAAVGWHPHEAGSVTEESIKRLNEMARHKKVVAIGEIGLDYYRNYSPREVQQRALEQQLEIASKMGLPVVVHSRRAEADMLAILEKWKLRDNTIRGVIHCFNGGVELARKYLDMGFYVSLGAYIGYPTSRNSHPTVRMLPIDRLLIETDSPFLPPQAYRGQRNEPSYLPMTLAALAAIKGIDPATVARETTANARRLFHLD